MIDDPWFSESLPGQLGQEEAAASIRATLEIQLREAVETTDLSRLDEGLESVQRATAAYRAAPGFDPLENVTLSVFDLFIAQARGIRDGEIIWSPRPLLRTDEG